MLDFSHIYSHRISESGSETLWERSNLSPFNELIVSWNALRPSNGGHLLSISVRCKNSWSEWLPYAEWSSETQKTFDSRQGKSGVYTFQDTLCLDENLVADAFRVKVECLGQADLKQFDTLYASAANLKQFKIHPPKKLEPISLPIKSLYSQMALKHPRNRDLCSPTSTCVAIDYLLKKRAVNPLDFATKVYDSGFDIFGNWIFNIAESYSRLYGRYACYVERLHDFTALHCRLKSDLPVVVSIKGPLPNAPLPFHQGHLMLVFGWDPIEQRVLCADPAYPSDLDTITSYHLNDFLAAWARRNNLSYTFLPK